MTYEDSLAALADSTRRQVFELLSQQPRPVGALAERLPVSRPAVSQHLKVLTDAGLVQCHVDGTRRIYAVRVEGLAELRAYLDRHWTAVMDSFAEEISSKKRKPDV